MITRDVARRVRENAAYSMLPIYGPYAWETGVIRLPVPKLLNEIASLGGNIMTRGVDGWWDISPEIYLREYTVQPGDWDEYPELAVIQSVHMFSLNSVQIWKTVPVTWEFTPVDDRYMQSPSSTGFWAKASNGYEAVIRFFVIVGGTPAVSYVDHRFTRRFEKDSRFDGTYTPQGYPHQTGNHLQLSDTNITEGMLSEWLNDTVAEHALETMRVKLLQKAVYEHPRCIPFYSNKLHSKRIHDKTARTYFRYEWQAAPYVSQVAAGNSWFYCQAWGNEYAKNLLPPVWHEFARRLAELNEKTWGQVSENDFVHILSMIGELE